MAETLNRAEDWLEAVSALRSLTEKIVLTPGARRGEIEDALQPGGVAVVLVAKHGCMTSRGVHAHGTHMVTKRMLGVFEMDVYLRRQFLASIDL